jgi:transcriptional regulator with XRE-family HTH domain
MATEFGKRLREARKFANLTQSQLAEKAGLASQGTVSELEKISSGSSFTPQLAAACKVNANWLATGEGDMHGQKENISINTIGGRALAFRKMRGWDQSRMAEAVGDSIHKVRELEGMPDMVPRFIAKLAEVMDTTQEDLLNGNSSFTARSKQTHQSTAQAPADHGISGLLPIETLMAGLSAYLTQMDHDARDDAGDVLRKLATKPENHARAAAMFAAAFQQRRRRVA